MTDKECFKQAVKDFNELKKLIKGRTYNQVVSGLSKKGYLIHDYEELCDTNYGTCCFTIHNENSKPKIDENSIEVWNDSECTYLGTFTLKQIKERG